MSLCPCASGMEFEACCKPYLSGEKKPVTAEALMRSRYSAFAVQQISYLKDTLLADSRDDFNEQAVAHWAQSATWTGMEVLDVQGGGENDDTGMVHFVARYQVRGKPQEFEEHATFQKVDGDWFYVDGDVKGMTTVRREGPKVGRNDPCPCGSGAKYKKCCGK